MLKVFIDFFFYLECEMYAPRADLRKGAPRAHCCYHDDDDDDDDDDDSVVGYFIVSLSGIIPGRLLGC